MNKSVMKCCICNNERIGEFITINNKKYHLCCIEQLQQENKQLKEQVQDLKADYGTIAQIERDLYKEVIEEVREFVGSEEMYNCSFEEETNKLLQILDKAMENKQYS